jgi:hypothetical protein
LRQEHGCRQIDLAEVTGIHENHVSGGLVRPGVSARQVAANGENDPEEVQVSTGWAGKGDGNGVGTGAGAFGSVGGCLSQPVPESDGLGVPRKIAIDFQNSRQT